MDNKLLKSHSETIAGLIFDEDKIVTYKSLSRNLGIHVNLAKQLLQSFLSEKKAEKSFPICATYLLGGKLNDGSRGVSIVNETEKESEVTKYIELTSDHVYSLQKGKSLKDIHVLYGIGCEDKMKQRESIIKCSKSILKCKSAETSDSSVSDKKQKTTSNVESDKTDKKSEPSLSSKNVTKSSPTSETVVPAKKPDDGGKTANENTAKSPKKVSPVNNKTKGDKKQNQAAKPGGNIANFFANAAQKGLSKSVKNTENDSVAGKKDNFETGQSRTSTTVIEEEEEVKKSDSSKDKVTSKGRQPETLKRKNEGTKRKRIQLFSDSDDSDSGNEESIPEDQPEVEEPSIKVLEEDDNDRSEAESSRVCNKRKKRKILDVTVMNEDGYLETRKEVAFVTDSEPEEEQEEEEKEVESTSTTSAKSEKVQRKTSKGDRKSGKEEQATAGPKKQSSLLTFFKKN